MKRLSLVLAALLLALPAVADGFGSALGAAMSDCRAAILDLASGDGSTEVYIECQGTRPSGLPYYKDRQGQTTGYADHSEVLAAMNACSTDFYDIHETYGASGVWLIQVWSNDGSEGYYLFLEGAADFYEP